MGHADVSSAVAPGTAPKDLPLCRPAKTLTTSGELAVVLVGSGIQRAEPEHDERAQRRDTDDARPACLAVRVDDRDRSLHGVPLRPSARVRVASPKVASP